MTSTRGSAALQSAARLRALQILRQRSAFAQCPEPVLDDIMRRAALRQFRKGEYVCRQGDAGDSLMIVLTGSLKVTNVTADAKEVILGFLRAGALVGEIAALDGRKRTANVIALEPSEAIVIYRRDLLQVLRGSADTLFALINGLCDRLRTTISLVESFALDTEARVASGLLRLAEQHGQRTDPRISIDLKLTQRDLGGHLGLTRETISRMLTELRKRGLIEMQGTSIVILDSEALRQVAEDLAY